MSNSLILFGGQCLRECPSSLYFEKNSKSCKACHSSNCFKCTGPGELDCRECHEGSEIINGDCIPSSLVNKTHYFPFAILAFIWLAICMAFTNYASSDPARNFNFQSALLVGWSPINMAMIFFETYFYLALGVNFLIQVVFSVCCGIILSILLSIIFLIVLCTNHKGTALNAHWMVYACETTTSMLAGLFLSVRSFKMIYSGWGQTTNGYNLVDFRKNAHIMKKTRTLKSINTWFSFLSLISDGGLIVAALQVVT